MKKILTAFTICIFMLLNLSLSFACTMFNITKDGHTWFANSEDWDRPQVNVWFTPASEGNYGAMFIGFEDFWEQGGMNDQGLCFDWFAGGKTNYKPLPGLKNIDYATSRDVLKTCATVEEAIQYYHEVNEPGFGFATTMLTDKSGDSAIIGWNSEKNELEIIRKKGNYQIQGYGMFDENKVKEISTNPTISNMYSVIIGMRQMGTAYQNIFDLQNGDFYITYFEFVTLKKFNLNEELAKGAHNYELSDFFIKKHNKSVLIAYAAAAVILTIIIHLWMNKSEKRRLQREGLNKTE